LKVEVGPAPQPSAVAWIGWAHGICRELRDEAPSAISPSVDALDEVDAYLGEWISECAGQTFQWHADIHADQLEYLVQAFFSLDVRCRAEAQRGVRAGAPVEGRPFYLVLVRALLHALQTESPARAAFADRLLSFWPTAMEAN